MEWKAPKHHRFGEGWIVGTVNGEQWFSDSHAMFLGKRKGKTTQINPPEGMQKVFDGSLSKRPVPTRVRKRTLNRGVIPVVILDRGVRIQTIFYDYVKQHFKRVRLFLGARFGDSDSRYVLCKVGPKIIGVIAPVCR